MELAEKKITQGFLAKALGVAVDTLNAYEQDEVKPTYDHLLDIANALNVSLDLLTGRTDVELDFKKHPAYHRHSEYGAASSEYHILRHRRLHPR